MNIRNWASAFFSVFATVCIISLPSTAQDLRGEIEGVVKEYLAAHPEEIGKIAKDYLVKHPEAFQEILVTLLKSGKSSPGAQSKATANADKSAIVKNNALALFSSAHQVTVGNPQGNVTLVEFFDYNCGFCKRALADLVELMKADPNIKVVLKELPILGPASAEAARVAIAVRMQDASGGKYLEFHQKLLSGAGKADKARALAVAQELGLDMGRLEKDLSSEEVDRTLAESRTLAQALGITGTPSYVVGEKVVPGAVGKNALNEFVKAARG